MMEVIKTLENALLKSVKIIIKKVGALVKNTSSFIKYLGIAFVLVGLLKISGFIKIEFKHIFSLSLAGFWFVIFDFISYYSERVNRNPLEKFLEYARKATLFLSAITIIVVPFTPIKWNIPFLQVITDSLVYLSLGIIIFLIGVKGDNSVKESKILSKNNAINENRDKPHYTIET